MRDVYLDVNCNYQPSQNKDLIVGNPYKEGCTVRFGREGAGDRGVGLPRTYSTIKLKVGWVC